MEQPLRVAAYCRVSTDSKEQLGSLENQIEFYTNYIRKQINWTLAGIYSDNASGVRIKKRTGYQQMMKDCKDYLDEYDSSILTEYLHVSNPLSKNFKIFAADVDIIKFAKCCNAINAMCLNLVEDLAMRHPENKSFLINGPLSYAKLYC